MRINKFLLDKLTHCVFDSRKDCIKYDWRFGKTADPDAVRWWFKNRPCKECVFGVNAFKASEIPRWEYTLLPKNVDMIGHRPIVLTPEAVRSRLGYFDVFYQFAVPVSGTGVYSDDPFSPLSVLFPLDPLANSWNILRKDISGFADRQTLIYFAKYYEECLMGELREHIIMLCQRILDVGGDVDCLFHSDS